MGRQRIQPLRNVSHQPSSGLFTAGGLRLAIIFAEQQWNGLSTRVFPLLVQNNNLGQRLATLSTRQISEGGYVLLNLPRAAYCAVRYNACSFILRLVNPTG